jgi:prolyl 4-hydroxylase
MDASWRAWTKDCLDKGCDPLVTRDTLLKHFPLADVEKEMGDKFPREGVTQLATSLYEALSNIRITRIAKRVETDLVQLYTLDDFMTAEECEEMMSICYAKLRPSSIPNQDIYPDFRTSSSCDLVYMDDPLVRTINLRISETIGINPSYADGIQAQVYEVGQQFKAHRDYFEPHSDHYKKFASVAGNRTWTFMVYLNNTPKGGSTYFTDLDKTFYPKQGMALIWNNLNPDGKPNPKTMHWGKPVEEGNKVVITKWFRENSNGKMLLD